MFEILGKNYYIDLDAITEKCRTTEINEDEENEGSEMGINLIKYETIKLCMERVLVECQEIDENLGAYSTKNLSLSFKLGFNTLYKYEIIVEEED